jgi:serpin B
VDTAENLRSDFATRLYDRLAATEAGKNLFLSPFSIRVALAMCAAGARGETRRVLADLIGAPEGVEEQNRQFARLLKSIQGDGDRPFQLVTANALWGQQGFRYKPAFQRAIANFYGGAFQEVNFQSRPDEALRTINAWVSAKTREKIRELVKRDFIRADTRLILTNAIYFKGRWEKVFQKEDTRDEDWHGPGGTGKVQMMHRKGGYLYHDGGYQYHDWGYLYYDGETFQALDLPYQGRQLSMLVVLPRARDGLASLERQWAGGTAYRRVAEGLNHQEAVLVWLPRFKLEAEFRLKPLLCGLHAERAFSDEADFGGIAEEPLKISEVVHKAFVEVNEEGTEASAATAVGMPFCGMPSEPTVFRADHPFLFHIRDRRTNAVLFSGRLLDPR